MEHEEEALVLKSGVAGVIECDEGFTDEDDSTQRCAEADEHLQDDVKMAKTRFPLVKKIVRYDAKVVVGGVKWAGHTVKKAAHRIAGK